MELTINTPALLFPAISLIMLAYTNRFLALANVVRNLHDRYNNRTELEKINIHLQIKNLKMRIRIVKNMQILGVMSILLSIISTYFIYIENQSAAHFAFAFSLVFFLISLVLSLIELIHSTKCVYLSVHQI